jgi:hypothetical protein
MRRITAVILALLAVSAPAVAEGASYYVSPSGDDDNNGLSAGSAWASIDNGDQKGILVPGDTVNVLAGGYIIAATVRLTTDATSVDRIIYRSLGEGDVVLDMNSASGVLLLLEGMNVVVQGFEITGTRDQGIDVKADSCIVMECHVHHTGKECFRVEGSECLFLWDIAAYSSEEGFRNEGGADNNLYYNNTVYGNNKHGFDLHDKNSQVINNIIVGNDHGINGDADNTCMYNDVWGNASDYAGGASDDGGSISADPRLVDPSGANFHLGYGSEAVDAGLDIGYSYRGEAPDMGAVESCPVAARDEFNAQSYANSDGTRLWAGPWAEFGEMDGPDAGLVLVSDHAGCCPEPYCLRLGGNWDSGASNFGARRELNLTGASFAYLSYTYRRDPDDGYYASSPALVQVSGNGGVTWDTLQVIGDGEDAACMPMLHDVSAYISGSMLIRFITNSASSIAGYIYFDDIQVQFDGDCAASPALIQVRIETPGGAAFGDTTLTTDNDTTRMYCRGYSEGGDPLGDLPALWSVIGEDSIGTVPAGPGTYARLTLKKPGTGYVVASYDDSTADTTGAITCVAGEPAYLVISPNEALLSSDSTLQFTCVSYDADGNATLPQITPDWRVFGGIGVIDESGFFEPTRTGEGRISATGGGLADTTGIIKIVAGKAAYIDVTPDYKTVIEGKTAAFAAKAYDADSNFVAVITNQVVWSTNDPTGSVSQQGVYTAGTDLSPPDYYVIAQYGGLADTSLVTVVTDGTVSYVRVEWLDGTPVGDTTFTTDDDANVVYCRGYDSGGIPMGDQSAQWRVLGPDSICRCVPETGTSATLILERPGTGRIEAAHKPAIRDTSGVITCLTGEPAALVISPDSATIMSDSTLDFACLSIDADSNATDPQVAVEWSVLGGIGTITGVGHFTPAAAGTGYVVAAGGGLADTTGPVVVIPGELAVLTISPLEDTISADSTRLFTASGYDGMGIPITELGTLFWYVLGGIGTIDETGLFTAVKAGYGKIKVVSSLGPEAVTDTIEVVAGDVVYIDVIPPVQIVVEDSSFQFSAFGFDADSNFAGDYRGEALWQTSDPTGSVTGSGLYTAGTNPSPPVYYVTARLHLPLGSLHYVSDSSAVTVVTSGSLDHVQIEWEDGTLFGDTTLTTDDDETLLFCRAYNSGNNLIGDAAASWSLLGTDGIGTVEPGPAGSTALTLTDLGTGRVRAVFMPGILDTSGLITCIAGNPSVLSISPDTATVTAGSSLEFTTSTFDADGNPAVPVSVDMWEVLGGIGSISAGGTFTGEAAGVGAVACHAGGLADTTGPVRVIADVLTDIVISPDSVDVALGGAQVFTADGYDAYGNSADCGHLSWEVIGAIGAIDTLGLFTGLEPGKGRVAVESSIGGVSDTNRVVTVLPSSLAILVVTPDTASVKVTGNRQFLASGFDADYAPVEAGPLDWEVLGGVGEIGSTGMFTATSPGVGYVTATSALNGISDTTNMIVVEVPTVEEIPLGNMTVHAGDAISPVLAFRVSNSFNGAETVESITVRDASRGYGTAAQVRSNVDSLTLYVDSNGNSRLDPSDGRIAAAEFTSALTTLTPSPYVIGPGSSRRFFVSAVIGEYPHDGDSLDLFLLPDTDIALGDGSVAAGPDTLNSLGFNIIDGLIANQVHLTASDFTTVSPGEGIFNALTIDIPRNGYAQDVLQIFSVFNAGTADTLDLDSLLLYKDGGDGVWTGAGQEVRIGDLSFTGDQWELSGINTPLAAQMSRFYLAAKLSGQPEDGATLSFGVPLHGLEMASSNDGPVDAGVEPPGTISVVSSESVIVRAVKINPGKLTPGSDSGPISAFELVNGYPVPVNINSLGFTSYSWDPSGASQEELDSQVAALSIWLDRDGDLPEQTAADSLIAGGSLANGEVIFDTEDLAVPAGGGVVGLFITIALDGDNSKNANLINFGVAGPGHVDCAGPVTVSGDFPVKNPDDHEIEIFPASAVGIHALPGATLYGGDTDCLLLDFSLPRNGYSDDVLESLRIANRGSAVDGDVLRNVKFWADRNSDGYAEDDSLLGYFALSDTCWDISSLSYRLGAGENRFFITTDVAPSGFRGGTLRFEIPVQGAGYRSDTDGPDDMPVGNTESHFVLPMNRITVISIPGEASTVYPGTAKARVLTFALYNGYVGEAHELNAVRLSNRTRSVSGGDFADFELGQVSLYYDSNSNRFFDDDSLLASGYFGSGRLGLDGLSVALPPESLSYFFVTSNIPLGVIDADTLDVRVEEPSHFTFAGIVNLNGDLPLTRGRPLVIDGSVRRQYESIPVSSRTLAPGDASVVLFAFRPASNGDLPDTLTSLSITNMGTAGAGDISNLRLWQDVDGDENWDPADMMSGEFAQAGGYWTVTGLGTEIEGEAPGMFVTGDVAPGAIPNSSFRAALPLGGCNYASANDGPIDSMLVSDQMFVISSSGLRITYYLPQPTYSIGQGINLVVDVTNITPNPLEGVYCEALISGDPGTVDFDSSYAGPAGLISGETARFTYYHTAAAEGEALWNLKAYSESEAESSATVATEPVLVQGVPSGVMVAIVNSIPTAVTRGQTHVFPLSIKYHHSDVSPLCAAVRLDSLRIDVKDGLGNAQPAGDAFSRMVLGAGYTNLAIVESFGSESSVLLEFVEPATIAPGEEQILSLRVDIDSTAEASAFILSVEDENSIRFRDSNTGSQVPVDDSVAFPLKTASCAINEPSRSLAVSCVPLLGDCANYGQQNLGLMNVVFRHYGSPGNSQIQLTGLTLEFADQSGSGLAVGDLVDEVRLLDRQAVIGEAAGFGVGDTQATVWLSSPLVVGPGQTDTLRVEASVRAQSPYPGFSLLLSDSTRFILRDLSSGSTVPAVGDTAHDAHKPVFPMNSGYAALKQPAGPPDVCLVDRLPESVVGGADSVTLVELALDYPSSASHSPLFVSDLRVSVLDTLGRVLDCYQLFDRIGFAAAGEPAQYASSIEMDGGRLVFRLGEDGLRVDPGGSLDVVLIADIEADAPYDNFLLRLAEADGLNVVDATDPDGIPGFNESPGCEGLFPFETRAAGIFLPAGTPVIEILPLPARMGVPDEAGIPIFAGSLKYETAGPQGDLVLLRVEASVLEKTSAGDAAVAAEDVFHAVHLVIGDEPVATDSVLAGFGVLLEPGSEYAVSRGSIQDVTIVCDLSPAVEPGNYLLEFGDQTFAELADRNLGTQVYPDVPGVSFPLTSAQISVAANSLASSFTNYPNPFNPSRGEETTIGFFINEEASIDIEIFTITGDAVRTVALSSMRSRGAHQEDTWSGLTAGGLEVLPGTYFCRITARYPSGATEVCRRKVMVIR